MREEDGGHWYRTEDPPMEGWLCPALFTYFDEAPEKLFVNPDGLSHIVKVVFIYDGDDFEMDVAKLSLNSNWQKVTSSIYRISKALTQMLSSHTDIP